MIDGKTIKFGYGDVLVKATLGGSLIFRQMNINAICGEDMRNKEYQIIGEPIIFELTVKDCCALKRRLIEIHHHEIDHFEFKGYILDFSNFNLSSVEVCLKQLDMAMAALYMLLAC